MLERFISFSQTLIKSENQPKFYYLAVLRNEELILQGLPKQSDQAYAGPIQWLIEQAQVHEWGIAIERYIIELSEVAHEEPNLHQVIEYLLQGPWTVFDSSGQPQDIFMTLPGLETRVRANDRKIIAEARKIMARKTLLLVPDSVAGATIPQEHNLLNTIAEELKQRIESAPEDLDIALVRVQNTEKSHHQGLFSGLMKALFSHTTQLRFKDSIHTKEGPLLIEGATGTGKTQAASLIATQLGKKLYEINLAAISDDLLEARMRGYRKGTFTGAIEDREGFFEMADGHVLFLDELQSTSMASQTQLLDLLSAVSNSVRISRLGEEKERKVYSVKVIMATNQPADKLILENQLREDLFHRIRDVIRFKGLTDWLQDGQYQRKIFTLLWLYRWSSFVHSTTDDIKNIPVNLLFPRFEEGATELIRSAQWPGNFRQFERFAYDLYWKLSHSASVEVSKDLVQELLNNESDRFEPSRTLPASLDSSLSGIEEKARFVERTLTDNSMNISRSLLKLAHYKLKSRPSLKTFLIKNQKLFTHHFLNDSRIKSFIGISD
ncbi:MAG: sigma 54-interacting transcriptional regulator [Pseudomonas sp.]|nr:sigma 54-interacting transcriptional regulator [Pseudomonas sp.]